MGRAGCVRSAALLGVAMLAAACTSDVPTSSATTSDPVVEAVATETASTEDTAGATPRATDEDARTESQALDFTARRLEGGTFDGRDHAGSHVVLWMWAPWCPQCNREAPHVADAVDRFGDQVTFVGVPGHDTDDAHREFVEEHGLEDVVQAVDDDGSLWARFGINYQPAWVFVDEDGGAEVVAGGLYDDLAARIQALVDG